VAPLEFLFLADAFFQERGRRSKVELIYATPLEGAFTKPKASALLGDMLSKRNIYVETDFLVSRVDGEAGKIHSWDGRSLPFDLLVEVPVHGGAEAIRASGLGDAQGWVPTDPHSLQSTDHPEIFVLGDATNLPVSKAGSVAHFQGEVLTENILRYIRDLPLLPDFDGHANCFIETGHGKAMLIDFNYKTEPLPGRFPLPGIGPFTLLEESAVNHWGKLGFRWIYWNMLLRGEDLPLDHRMLLAGKWS
jgi:sulfide:quinone oxidoreductase